MDFLNAGLDLVQSRLAWVATDTFNWKLYLQVSSWGVCLFESYLLCASFRLTSPFSPFVAATRGATVWQQG